VARRTSARTSSGPRAAAGHAAAPSRITRSASRRTAHQYTDGRCGSMRRTMDAFLTADGLVALATLTALEIVLGVDNVVFIAILTARLPASQQISARRVGLTLALGIRIGLLF